MFHHKKFTWITKNSDIIEKFTKFNIPWILLNYFIFNHQQKMTIQFTTYTKKLIHSWVSFRVYCYSLPTKKKKKLLTCKSSSRDFYWFFLPLTFSIFVPFQLSCACIWRDLSSKDECLHQQPLIWIQFSYFLIY